MRESGGVWCVFLSSFVPGTAAACPVLEEAVTGGTGAVDFLVWSNLSWYVLISQEARTSQMWPIQTLSAQFSVGWFCLLL